jgi:hypothetical protein
MTMVLCSVCSGFASYVYAVETLKSEYGYLLGMIITFVSWYCLEFIYNIVIVV